MPTDSSDGLLGRDGLVGGAKTDVKNGGLLPQMNMFDPPVPTVPVAPGEGDRPCDDDLAVGWSPAPLVRTASTSSAGSAEADESEVRTNLVELCGD